MRRRARTYVEDGWAPIGDLEARVGAGDYVEIRNRTGAPELKFINRKGLVLLLELLLEHLEQRARPQRGAIRRTRPVSRSSKR
jgi:hypothetical protein